MNFRQRLLNGESLVGTFCAIPHPAATEMVASAGFDFLCLDSEHAAIDRETAENMLRAASVWSIPALVRVAGNTPELIGAALDGGAAGVLVPRVNTAEEARAAVDASRYPPHGSRGAGPGRASSYGGGLSGYLGSANDDIVVAVQIESVEAVQHVAEIAAVEGLDMLFIGPGDLSVSLGATGGTEHDTKSLQDAISSVVEIAKQLSQNIGLFRLSTDDVAHWADLGVSLFIVSSESMMMMAFMSDTASKAQSNLKKY
ncbi:HpcH/HpaI aldolase family protein [Nesterenkonia ebinurensis]|uniref:HpcH/HpaI aldolase family protein n=1 Tax=Nesterenkonia ebinurensis TaxID=2608252 RepID=UPI00123CF559|nr:aldolase/citrate lyase family protein [Nesterenkonia ebinurensis]